VKGLVDFQGNDVYVDVLGNLGRQALHFQGAHVHLKGSRSLDARAYFGVHDAQGTLMRIFSFILTLWKSACRIDPEVLLNWISLMTAKTGSPALPSTFRVKKMFSRGWTAGSWSDPSRSPRWIGWFPCARRSQRERTRYFANGGNGCFP